MVIDQGTILDRIDFNMESAVDNATVAVAKLTKAEGGHPKNALQMKCIIALVALIAIMLIVLIVKNTPMSN